jgi:hypothetical protein
VGLTAIFAAAVVPIIIMGAALELGKVMAAVWLKLNWHRAPFTYKMYLVPAVAFLMMLTSMGIFGFLSKAHGDQTLVSGDVQSKIAIYDDKIKVAKENIDANRKALKQLDEAVDQVMGRSSSEAGADKAVQIRRSQANDRKRLLAEIQAEQKTIASLNEEAAPIRAEVRKVEAEVGPLKYIAALIYGDNQDANLLESAVRWVIIMIVAVFDPLALVLILAAQQSMRWEREEEQQEEEQAEQEVEDFITRGKLVARGLDADEEARLVQEANDKIAQIEPEEPQFIVPEQPKPEPERSLLEQHPYLTKKFPHFKDLQPLVYKPELEAMNDRTAVHNPPKPDFAQGNYGVASYTVESLKTVKLPEYEQDDGPINQEVLEALRERAKEELPESELVTKTELFTEPTVEQTGIADSTITTEGITTAVHKFHPSEGYVNYEGKQVSIDALRGMRPDLIMSANSPEFEILFGTKFPDYARPGDLYTRIDAIPHRVYKFNGSKWMNLDRTRYTTYLQNIAYIQYLIAKIDNGEYDPELLTEAEQEEITSYLEKIKH